MTDILNNIWRCELCKLHAIAEEKDFHVCIDIQNSRIEGDLKWVFDGKVWYPLRLKKRSNSSDESLRLEQPDGDSPVPLKDGFKYYASFLVIR